ncbi:MAG: hypothetical protein A3A16_03875 [Candidatus Harrisonbacteria bacterium RIFCSPLOWO2_01_FULL_44_18]|uniref:Dipeptidylpeptidase IV N-terminal domain-containing protein n=1 Tax=Candidatus Harrisonbacteria bacterium RIFCSPLOWO2_01_FULL_44_18 TaxID=1798407 RepID=A0A1G1ZM51_9BACT|nr:MAG: hypothetical protein A3A16_03875 [Candidatus Harrisonbacteria bacterium RIFCSPLOWO2_01_FULL_44_18]
MEVLAAISAVIGLYFGWRYFLKPVVFPTPKAAPTEIPEEKLKAVSAGRAVNYWVNRQTNNIYYINDTGEVYKITQEGQDEKVISLNLKNIHFADPSPDQTKVLIAFGYPYQTVFTIFDSSDNSSMPLPEGATAATWDSSSTKIAYLKTNGGASALNILNLADKKSKEILKLAQKDLDLKWIAPEEIYLIQKPSALVSNQLWSFDLDKKTLRAIIKDEAGLMLNWSPDGQSALKFTGNSINNRLDLIDKNNNLLANITPTTLPSKCLYVTDKIYCAAPETMPSRTILPDDYLSKKIYSRDDFYVLELAEGFFAPIFFGSDVKIDATNLSIEGNRLLFINRYDQRIYSLEL